MIRASSTRAASRSRPGTGRPTTCRDGIRARPALGAKSHEGLRFDKRGYLYGIAETRGISGPAGQSGALFRFVPDKKGDLSAGQLQALQTDDGLPGQGLYGSGRWIDLERAAVQVNADAEAEAKGANQYERPEDVETGQSTGRDVNNGGNTLYVAITEGTHPPGDLGGVLAVDLSSKNKPFAYPYVGVDASNTTAPDFANPDNLALDREGNLVITEDTDTPPGGDIWIAAAPTGPGGQPAATVQKFTSLRDCAAEPTGVYFALDGTSNGPTERPGNNRSATRPCSSIASTRATPHSTRPWPSPRAETRTTTRTTSRNPPTDRLAARGPAIERGLGIRGRVSGQPP